MDINEKFGNKVTFYLIPENTSSIYDPNMPIYDKRIMNIVREVNSRGHRLGIHPGYSSLKNKKTFLNSVNVFKKTLSQNNINISSIYGRQHYLRWKHPNTANLYSDCKINFDSSLGYHDYPGFRCGTCFEYALFDPKSDKILDVIESPLIFMDTSVFSKDYLNLGCSKESFILAKKLKDRCKLVSGNYTVLWHNSSFDSCTEDFYRDIIG